MRIKKTNSIDKIFIFILSFSICLFILYPFIAVFNYGIDKNISSIFLDNKGYYLKLFFNSIKVAFGTTMITTLFSIFIALFYFINYKFRKVVLSILMLATISPPFVTSLSYINLFGRRGLITYNLLNLKIDPYGYFGIVSMQSVTHIAISSLLLIGFLAGVDRSILNSARSLGADSDNVLVDIILPLLKPALITVSLLTFIRSMADFTTPTIIGGKYNVLSTEGYLAFIAEGDISKAIILNIIILIPSIIVFIFYSKNFQSMSTQSKGFQNGEITLKKEGVIYNISIVATLFIIFIFIVLYGAIVLSAFTTMEYGKLVFTFENFVEVNASVVAPFVRSIIYALITSIVATFLGHLLQYYIYLRKYKSLKILDFISTLPYILPGTFFGLGYVVAFSSYPLKLTGTALIVLLNLLFKQFPFATKIAYSSISQISYSYINSVRSLGGTRMSEIKDVVLPMSKEGMYISFINGFTSTMTTIGSIIFLVYPSQKVATLVMFDAIESGRYEEGAVIAFYIILICLIVNILYYVIVNKKR